MATAAIDFGAYRTRLAIYDRRRQRPILRREVPTLAYVPGSGPIRVGDAALEPIKADPVGAIHDLKSRLGGSHVVRNRRKCHPADVILQLLADLRGTTLAHPDVDDPLTDCCLAVPLHFDTRQSESLQEAARLAGFSRVSTVDAPIAAIRHCQQHCTIAADHVVVCDLGVKARTAVLERRDSYWRADQELQPPCEWELDAIPPRLLMDALEHIAVRLSERRLAVPPLLLVGGSARGGHLRDVFQQEGWKGEVIIPDDPESAIALGAVDLWRICPECSSDQVPLFRVDCPGCGCPSCPECRRIVESNSVVCGTCGYPLAFPLG